MPINGRKHTRELYDALVAAFREKPMQFSHASRQARVTHRCAKRAWLEGWPGYDWARPIQHVLEEERVVARATLEEQQRLIEAQKNVAAQHALSLASIASQVEEEREKAKLDSARSHANEAQMCRIAQANSLQLMAFTTKLMSGALVVGEKVKQILLKTDETASIKTAMGVLKDISFIARQAIEVGKVTMELERIHLGQPTHVIRHEMEMTYEDAVAELEKGTAALQRAKDMSLSALGVENFPSIAVPVKGN